MLPAMRAIIARFPNREIQKMKDTDIELLWYEQDEELLCDIVDALRSPFTRTRLWQAKTEDLAAQLLAEAEADLVAGSGGGALACTQAHTHTHLSLSLSNYKMA